MKRFRILLFVIIAMLFGIQAYSYELDLSVDEEIQKKYNSSKLNYDVLPSLPKVESASTKPAPSQTSVPKTSPTLTTGVVNVTPVDKTNMIKIPKWTRFIAKSNQNISDSSRIGSGVSFTTISAVNTKYITIPSGAKIGGIIVNSHPAQPAGNGGLIVVRINSLSFNGKTYSTDGKIIKANYKKVFFNNIKGTHKYWSGVGKQVDKGENFYGKTKKVSAKMSNIPIIEILSPLPKIIGGIGYGVNAILAPVTGLCYKGGNISVPAGSQFEIRILEDTYVSK